MSSFERDITGKRFGRLVVLRQAGTDKNGRFLWLCKCDCGKEKIVHETNIRYGRTVSCGCYHREQASTTFATHGECKTRLYRIWCHMKERCHKESSKHYTKYGARGIRVCDEWQSFEPFRDWAIANGYQGNLTIDRIDNNNGYSPDNCRWATMKEQNNNRRNNHLITYNGKTQTMKQWADELDVSYSALQSRLYKGCSFEKAISDMGGIR